MSQSITLQPQQKKIKTAERAERLAVVCEMMRSGIRSTSAIMQRFDVSAPTAIAYRNEAMTLLREENKALDREHLRSLEEGRLLYWLEWTQERIQASSESQEKREWLKRLEALLSRYHAITGLNEITINNNNTEKRIVFHINAKQSTPKPIVEGEATPIQG